MKRKKFIMFSTPRHAPFSEEKGINNKKNIVKKRTPKILSFFLLAEIRYVFFCAILPRIHITSALPFRKNNISSRRFTKHKNLFITVISRNNNNIKNV
jgi:hypothetical protein